jgi:hypothetical protein
MGITVEPLRNERSTFLMILDAASAEARDSSRLSETTRRSSSTSPLSSLRPDSGSGGNCANARSASASRCSKIVRRNMVASHCHGMSCVSVQPTIADTAIASSSAWMTGGKSVLGCCFIGCIAHLNETCSTVAVSPRCADELRGRRRHSYGDGHGDLSVRRRSHTATSAIAVTRAT